MPRRGRSKGIVEETEPEAPSDIETPPTTVMTQDDVPDSGVESENQVMEIAVVEQVGCFRLYLSFCDVLLLAKPREFPVNGHHLV